jgi:hypothetical protein
MQLAAGIFNIEYPPAKVLYGGQVEQGISNRRFPEGMKQYSSLRYSAVLQFKTNNFQS